MPVEIKKEEEKEVKQEKEESKLEVKEKVEERMERVVEKDSFQQRRATGVQGVQGMDIQHNHPFPHLWFKPLLLLTIMIREAGTE